MIKILVVEDQHDFRELVRFQLEEHENEYMRKVLKITGFNITRACEILEISRPRFYRRLKELQLEDVVE